MKNKNLNNNGSDNLNDIKKNIEDGKIKDFIEYFFVENNASIREKIWKKTKNINNQN